jgi:DNA-binding SARP family transcriptional activator/predicted Zn-dependent protease
VIRINTFGGLSVRGEGDRPVSGAAVQPRRLAILALLARAGERGMNRDKVLALLWPDADDERGPRALAQALYVLRKDLGTDDAVTGASNLCLDPGIVSSDVAEFASAVSRGEDERAVALYQGPFLDGFRLTGAEEFDRWAERERAALAQDYSRALESLARAAHARGDPLGAVSWWQKLAALDPLNARITVGLMESLAAAGDRAGAIRHARVYELLVEQELDLPPDKEVMTLAERLRQTTGDVSVPAKSTEPATSAAVLPAEPATVAVPAPAVVPVTEPVPPVVDVRRRRALVLGLATLVIAVLGLFVLRNWNSTAGPPGAAGGIPVVAIGRIVAFGEDSGHTSMAAPVADLLATSLGRSRGIRVVSHGRMLELMRSGGVESDTGDAGAFIDAARRAGAAEVIDGTLYGRPGGGLRLDLRRVHLATGAIGDVQSVEGSDLFALVDSGTTRLVAALGTDAPAGSVTEVTTHSVAAYRMYEQCVRALHRGEYPSALAFCDDALTTDSMFALAAYYGAIAASQAAPESWPVRMNRANTLAAHAAERERLTITADWAYRTSSPALRPVAESLAQRYPAEVEGYLYSGIARVLDGEFLAAIAPLRRVVDMDSSGLRGATATCSACEAFRWWTSAYVLMDSLPAAERVARAGVRLQPGSWQAAVSLIEVLEASGRAAEAESTARVLAPANHPYDQMVLLQAENLLRSGDYDAADRLLKAQIQRGGVARQADAIWDLALSLRERGRIREAVDVARRLRVFGDPSLPPNARTTGSIIEAQLRLESGQPAVAAALFDSIANVFPPSNTASQTARHRAWMLTHAAGARFAAGDTAILARLADSVRTLGAASGFARDQRLHHHLRALLLSARGRDADAAAEFRAAIYSVTSGYTRTNLELARVLLRDGRAGDAVAVLQPALRGPLQASNLYVIRIELHELLARAWDAAGARDSALAHYDLVARAWSDADAMYKARSAAAQSRAAALRR